MALRKRLDLWVSGLFREVAEEEQRRREAEKRMRAVEAARRRIFAILKVEQTGFRTAAALLRQLGEESKKRKAGIETFVQRQKKYDTISYNLISFAGLLADRANVRQQYLDLLESLRRLRISYTKITKDIPVLERQKVTLAGQAKEGNLQAKAYLRAVDTSIQTIKRRVLPIQHDMRKVLVGLQAIHEDVHELVWVTETMVKSLEELRAYNAADKVLVKDIAKGTKLADRLHKIMQRQHSLEKKDEKKLQKNINDLNRALSA